MQLALNGAEEVHAIDVQREAVTNAFRKDLSDRLTGKIIDLYAWLMEESYDIIVASLFQMPVDPRGQVSGHRPMDYWGRNLLDHLINLLPQLMHEDTVVYLMHLSALSQLRTSMLLGQADLAVRVVDFEFFEFNDVLNENLDQIRRGEQQSDAFHLSFGKHDEVVIYLLDHDHKSRVRDQSPNRTRTRARRNTLIPGKSEDA